METVLPEAHLSPSKRGSCRDVEGGLGSRSGPFSDGWEPRAFSSIVSSTHGGKGLNRSGHKEGGDIAGVMEKKPITLGFGLLK